MLNNVLMFYGFFCKSNKLDVIFLNKSLQLHPTFTQYKVKHWLYLTQSPLCYRRWSLGKYGCPWFWTCAPVTPGPCCRDICLIGGLERKTEEEKKLVSSLPLLSSTVKKTKKKRPFKKIFTNLRWALVMQARTVRSRSAFTMPDMAGFFPGEVDGGVKKTKPC